MEKGSTSFRDRHVVTQKRGKSNVKSKSEKQTWEIHWMSMFSSVTGKDKEIDLRHKEWRQGIRKIMNSFWLGWTLADCEALMKKGRSRRYEYSDSNWNCSGKWLRDNVRWARKRRDLLQQIYFNNYMLLLILHLFYKVSSTCMYKWMTTATCRMYFLWNSEGSDMSREHLPLRRDEDLQKKSANTC